MYEFQVLMVNNILIHHVIDLVMYDNYVMDVKQINDFICSNAMSNQVIYKEN